MGKESCSKCGNIILCKAKRGKTGYTGASGSNYTGPTGPAGQITDEFDSIYVNNIYLLNTGSTGINIHDSFLLPTTGATASPFDFFSTISPTVTFNYGIDQIERPVVISRVGNSTTVSVPELTFSPGITNDKITLDGPVTTNPTLLPDVYIVSTTYLFKDGVYTGPARCYFDSAGDLIITSANEGNISTTNQLITDSFSFSYVNS